MKCRFCNSKKIRFEKTKYPRKNRTPIFRIKAVCSNCGRSFFVKQTKYIYKITKRLKWKLDPRYQEYLNRMKRAIDLQKKETASVLRRKHLKDPTNSGSD